METNYTQLEVLLITGTTLTSGKLSRKDESGKNHHLTDSEQLEEACWNGMLPLILPEIWVQPSDGRSLYLWQVNAGESFLELKLGEVPLPVEKRFSIVPQSFFSTLSDN